jgi:hypothetical protein
VLDLLRYSEKHVPMIAWAFHGEGLRNGAGDIKPFFLGKREPEDFLAERDFRIRFHSES